MRTPLILLLAAALAAPAVAQAQAAAPAPAEADWRTPDAQNVLVIDTDKGRILVELAPQIAPKHVERIKELTRAGFYDGRSFFRVIDDFMAQTGDPGDNGMGGSDKPDLDPEFVFKRRPETPFVRVNVKGGFEQGFVGALPVDSKHIMFAPMMADGAVDAGVRFCPGVAGMARGGDPGSGNSQFFLMRQFNDNLSGQYSAFGRVIAGLDVVRAIKTGEPVADPQDRMTKVQVLADMPAATRPKVRVIDQAGPWFTAEVTRKRAANGEANLCDVSIPVEVK